MVTLARAKLPIRRSRNGVERRRFGMHGSGAVACFALNVFERIDIGNIRAAGQLVTGHVAADTFERKLPLLVDQCLIRVAVTSRAPECSRFFMTCLAAADSNEIRFAGIRRERFLGRKFLAIARVNAPTEVVEVSIDVAVPRHVLANR